MTGEEHLRSSDILAYRERRLSPEEHTTAARHLLQCAECRGRLPLPTAEEFWRCLLGSDEEAIRTARPGSPGAWVKDSLAEVVNFGRPAMRNAVFAGFLLAAVLGFSFFLLWPGVTPENEGLVAAVEDPGSHKVGHPPDLDEPYSGNLANTEVSPSSSDPRKEPSETLDKARDRSSGRVRDVRNLRRTNSKNLANTGDTGSRVQAETRGETPCGGQRSIGLEATQTEAGLLLTWEKIRGAVAYNIYLSDLDERLIDHFETDDKTTYLVTAKLEGETVYRLRLIATLENGERIVSESQNFKLDELKQGARSSIGIRKKTAATVRCLEAKQ